MKNITFNRNTPVKQGDKVHLIAYDITCKVTDVLASQFTVTRGKRRLYFFYSDRGLTWNKV